MGRQKPAIKFAASMEVEAAGPLDARTVVPTKADLTLASNFPYAYAGLTVYVEEEQKTYTLTVADVTVLANWKEVGSGSGGTQELFLVPVDEDDLQDSQTQSAGTKECILTTPYTFAECLAAHEYGKVVALALSNTTERTNYNFIPLRFYNVDGSWGVGSQAYGYSAYVDYDAQSNRKYMIEEVSIVNQTNDTKVYQRKYEISSGNVEFKTINSSSIEGSGNLTTGKVTADYQSNSVSIYEGTDSSVQISKVDNDTIRVQGYGEDDRGQTRTLFDMSLADKGYVDTELSTKQDTLVSGTNIKTLNNESLLGSGNIDLARIVGSDWGVAKVLHGVTMTKQSGNAWYNATIDISDLNIASVNDYTALFESDGGSSGWGSTGFYHIYNKSTTQFTITSVNYGDSPPSTLTSTVVVFAKGFGSIPAGGTTNQVLAKKSNAQGDIEWVDPATVADVDQTYDATSSKAQSGIAVAQGIAATAGDLSELLTTDQTDLVSAINEVYEKSGEPFRVKQWAENTLDVTIPVCTSDVGNTSIPKLVYTIDDTEGADYQIVGMISYEVFDANSGGNRINCWPVCQFTGNNQKELSVRFMCAGSTAKTAKRISAWVLLKHR